MAAAPVAPKVLTVVPATAEVNANAVCQFTVDPAGTPVTWSIAPAIGTIDPDGVYHSPKPENLKMPQTVIVKATPVGGGPDATACITLTDAPAKIEMLGWYAVVVALVIGALLLAMWAYLHKGPVAPVVIVNPAAVTLDPAADDKFTFSATVLGDPKNAVTWSIEPADAGTIDTSGNFHRKLDPSGKEIDTPVKVTARSMADSSRCGSAMVKLIPKTHLEISPVSLSAFPGQQVEFRLMAKSDESKNATNGPAAAAAAKPEDTKKDVKGPQSSWSVSRSDIAAITPDGVFTAGTPDKPTQVVISAWGPAVHEQASVTVSISVPFQPTDVDNWPILLFVIICGALGSMIYYTSSFVAYVGNRNFRSSWFWFYISRPFVGGGLAVIFFFLTKWGKISGASATDLASIGAISALVGLFSDKAVKKLSDILDVLLSTDDLRKDKITDSKTPAQDQKQAAATTQPATNAPKITSITPASAASGQDIANVQINGSNLSNATVTVNGQPAAATIVSDQSIKLTISGAQVTAPAIVISVTTAQGSATGKIPVT